MRSAYADAQLLRDILAIQPAMVSRFTTDGRVVWCNDAYAAHFLRTPGEVIGASWVDLGVELGHDTREHLERTLAAVLESSRCRPGDDDCAAHRGRGDPVVPVDESPASTRGRRHGAHPRHRRGSHRAPCSSRRTRRHGTRAGSRSAHRTPRTRSPTARRRHPGARVRDVDDDSLRWSRCAGTRRRAGGGTGARSDRTSPGMHGRSHLSTGASRLDRRRDLQ